MIENLSNFRQLLKVNYLKSQNLYPFLRKLSASEGSTVTYKNKKQVMIGSNNYLGMTHHPQVIEKTQKAIEKYGTGCTGSRLLNGNLEIHEQLEDSLAKFVGKEKALVFATGMQVNLGVLSCLNGPKDCVFSDAENHASIVDAVRLSFGSSYKFKHNETDELAVIMEENRSKYKNSLVVADGVFSMTGDIFKLDKAIEVAKKNNSLIYVDDAHGIGVLGERGRGTANYFGKTNETDLIMGTFSKSFASIGGFIAASEELIEYIKVSARSFIFSAAAPPSSVATVQAILDIISKTDDYHKALWKNVAFMREGLASLGLFTYGSQTPIIPILVGDDLKAMQITKFLEDNGVFATPVIYPAVPKGEALIRTSYMATHQLPELEYCLDIFEKVSKTFQLPSNKLIQ